MDNKSLKRLNKEVPTFRSGKYVLSLIHNSDRLDNPLMEARILDDLLRKLPILPARLKGKLDSETILKRHIYASLHTEGSSLNQDKINEILRSHEDKKNPARDALEVLNMKTAIDFIGSLKPTDEPFKITQEGIKEINAIVTHGIKMRDYSPGDFRNDPLKIGEPEHGDILSAPKILSDIKVLIFEFVAWFNQEDILKLDPRIRAATASFYLTLISPFAMANGRTARLIEAVILHSAGLRFVPFLVATYYHENKADYFKGFLDSLNTSKDITPFLDFTLRAHLAVIKEARDYITSAIRRLVLGDYYRSIRTAKKITAKQFSLLSILLEKPARVTLHELFKTNPYRVIYSGASERTARRDLIRLSEMGLIRPAEGKSFELNLYIIG